MTPAQFEVLAKLFNSGFKAQIWGSDAAGWRIGPHRISTVTKRSLERRCWVKAERTRVVDGEQTDWLVWTDEGRRAFIAAGGDPGQHGRRRAKRRFHLKREK